ncbi:hypothetical protein Barb7_02241 [Bacteroidales bacterium Barb7]|nr:hypothetical protein Barb7_02241 [Bacteroidales bacterium Barb7]
MQRLGFTSDTRKAKRRRRELANFLHLSASFPNIMSDAAPLNMSFELFLSNNATASSNSLKNSV